MNKLVWKPKLLTKFTNFVCNVLYPRDLFCSQIFGIRCTEGIRTIVFCTEYSWFFTIEGLLENAEEFGKASPQFSNKALDVFENYNWPGNVRELENVIQRLLVMEDDNIIDAPDLPSLMRFSGQL